MSAIVLDLETVPIDDVQTYLEPVSAPANYKDEEKIASYITEKTAEHTNRAALDPDLCRIVCLGTLGEKDTEPHVTVCRDEHDERAVLSRLWNLLAWGDTVITFNGFKFDLPVIMRRSLYLGIPWKVLSVDRYRSQHIDLWQKLTFNGAIQGHTLGFYAQRFGLPGELEHSGAEIGALVKALDWPAVRAHCRQDVLWTAAIAKRLGVWDGLEQPTEAMAL